MLFTPNHLSRLSTTELADFERRLTAILPGLIEGSPERRTTIANLNAIRRERSRRHSLPRPR